MMIVMIMIVVGEISKMRDGLWLEKIAMIWIFPLQMLVKRGEGVVGTDCLIFWRMVIPWRWSLLDSPL